MILILNQLILLKVLQNWINERLIPLKNEFEKNYQLNRKPMVMVKDLLKRIQIQRMKIIILVLVLVLVI